MFWNRNYKIWKNIRKDSYLPPSPPPTSWVANLPKVCLHLSFFISNVSIQILGLAWKQITYIFFRCEIHFTVLFLFHICWATLAKVTEKGLIFLVSYIFELPIFLIIASFATFTFWSIIAWFVTHGVGRSSWMTESYWQMYLTRSTLENHQGA